MKSRTSFLLIAVLLLMGSLQASPVTPKRAATVAQSFFSTLSPIKGNTLQQCTNNWHYDAIYLFTGTHGGVCAGGCRRCSPSYSGLFRHG
ncbi:MAG: hypothetical protein Q4D03_09155 [Bacteroidales bacterium]|nr:hypothetical protein [Bacteroidales bacterium]